MHLIRFLPFILPPLLACSMSGQLCAPTPDHLANLVDWFSPLIPGTPGFAPSTNSPDSTSGSSPLRIWGGWHPNLPPSTLGGPIIGSGESLLPVEIVYLGETGNRWASFGYSVDGVDQMLAATPTARISLDHLTTGLGRNQTLDVYIETAAGDRLYVFGPGPYGYALAHYECHWGILMPTGHREHADLPPHPAEELPFAVFAFADQTTTDDEGRPAYFAFALRAGYDHSLLPVPEPATYGVAAAALLVALSWRRRR